MNKQVETIHIQSTEQIPSLEHICQIPRNQILKIVFDGSIENQRQHVAADLKQKLEAFLVAAPLTELEINISKLITDKEIEDNQVFFEDCAKDYRQLAETLIFSLAKKLKTTINPDFPLLTFGRFKTGWGKMDEWKYFVHGYHCLFENTITQQRIEVPLVFGLEFGDLDPYFFTIYIKSTPHYKPLPVEIYHDYHDGCRINEKILALGKFERINSNIENHFGIAVTDREKIEIKKYNPEQYDNRKFNLWRFIGFKK